MKRISWSIIEEFYKKHFGIDKWLVELFANEEILLLCASGASNNTISFFTDLPVDEIKEAINNTFKFEGWERDLRINPYGLYSDDMKIDGKLDQKEFKQFIDLELKGEYDPNHIYHICKMMWEIECKINEQWV